jgi:hypothetical protein
MYSAVYFPMPGISRSLKIASEATGLNPLT